MRKRRAPKSRRDRTAGRAPAARRRPRSREPELSRRETALVADLARSLSVSLDLDTVLQRLVDATRELCRSDRAQIALRDRGSDAMVFRYSTESRLRGPQRVVVEPGKGVGGQVLVTGRPFRAARYARDPRITRADRATVEGEGIVGSMAVPIRIGERVEGLLFVDSRSRAFTDRQEAVLVRLAHHAATAIGNARMYVESQRRLAELTTVQRIARAINSTLRLEEVFQAVVTHISTAFGYRMVSLYLVSGEDLALQASVGYDRVIPLIPLDRGMSGRVARSGRAEFARDAVSDADFLYAAPAARQAIIVPLKTGDGQILGILAVESTGDPELGESDLALLEPLADQVSVAVANARLHAETQERLRETEALLSVSSALSSTLDLEPLLRHFLRQVARTIGADSVGVWLADPVTGVLEPFVGYRVPPQMLAAIRECRLNPADSAFYADAIGRRRARASSDAASDPRIPASLKDAAPHRVQLFTPIVTRDQVIGALIAVWWEERRELSERELALTEAMGNQAGVAVETARLFQENQRKLGELSVLHELSRAVTSQLDVAGLVRTIHREVARVLDTRNMVILLYDEATREFEVALRMLEGTPDPNPIRRYPFGYGLMSRVVERRQAIRTRDYAESCRREGVEPIQTSAMFPHWLGAPMLTGDEVLGVLALRDATRPFTEADERLLVNIAGLAALAVRNARLFEEKSRALDELGAAQDRLVRAEKLRALGELAGGVAHDFNNILAIVLARAQLLLSQAKDRRLRRQLEVIERAALDGARTVRRIQEFTGMRRAGAFRPVDLTRLVEQVVDVTRSRWKDEAQARGARYEVVLETEAVPAVAGDPSELREALTNLVLNALDAMPQGGRLTFRTGAEGRHVYCVVADAGAGMSEAVRSRLFDPFFTTKGERGTGLGLSIVYGIVTRHGGEIEVTSAEGRGSVFTIRLPVADELPAAPRPVTAPRPRSGAKLLVIEDEADVRDVLAELLAELGHVVVACGDGPAGLASVEAEPFDLVLTDLGMPGLSGWDVTRLVKERRPETPVALITGWADQIDPAEARQRGVDFLIAKPFAANRVAEILAQILPVEQRPPRAAG